MTTSRDLKRVYASAPSDRRYVDTLELYHPAFAQRFFITNDTQAWQFLLSASAPSPTPFVPVPFYLTWPTSDGKGQQDLQIQLDNIGREAMEAIEAASFMSNVSIGVALRVYLDIANSPPQNDPPLVLTMNSITIDAASIVGTASRADTLNFPFPTEVYRVDLFSGLNR